MFKKVDRFVIKSFIGPLLVTFFICVFVLLMQFLWRYIDDLVGKGLALNVIAELLLYASANLVPMALPLSVLLASIMVFGNMGEQNELMAFKASGVPLRRIMMPLFIFNLFVASGAFLFSNYVLPYTNLQYGALLYDVRQQRPEINIKQGIFYDGIPGMRMKIREKDPKTNMMRGIMIYDHRGLAGNLNVTIADSASMIMSDNKQYIIFTAYNGIKYEEVRERSSMKNTRQNLPFRRQIFGEQQLVFELSGYEFSRTNTDLFKHNYQMLNLTQLNASQDSLEKVFFDRRVKYFKRMFANNYFVKVERRDNFTGVYENLDSLFEKFDYERKLQVYDKALNLVRAAKSSHENNQKDFKNREEWINKHKIEWHRKFTLAIACLILMLIGAPLGAIIRKGGFGVPVIVSVFFFLIYYIISMIGERSVKAGEIVAFEGMWLASIILLPIGVFLTYKATHDSTLLNVESYSKILNRFIPGFLKQKKRIYKPESTYSQIDKARLTRSIVEFISEIDFYAKNDLLINYTDAYKYTFKLLPSKHEFSIIVKDYKKIYNRIYDVLDKDNKHVQEIFSELPFIEDELSYYRKSILFPALILLITFPVFVVIPSIIFRMKIKNKIDKIIEISNRVLVQITYEGIDNIK